MTRYIIAIFVFVTSAAMARADVPGSADLPDLGRFETSAIVKYVARDFDQYTFPTGVAARGGLGLAERVEGRTVKIAYRARAQASTLEVLRNFTNRMAQTGYRMLFECEGRDCGGTSFAHHVETLPIPHMQLDPSTFRYAVGVKEASGTLTWVSVMVSPGRDRTYVQVTAVEAGALQNKMIDAAGMASGLSSDGRVALYGIYFDTDSVAIKPESRPTLDEIAKLLQSQPGLNIIVVGHTDNQGALDYNRSLSTRRAQAVAATLINQYGVAANRLMADGVAFLAPLAPNTSEEGRARNRRVELVRR